MEWISVEERVPPDDDPNNARYIVWTEDGLDVAYHYGEGEFGNPGYEDSMKVTHWMSSPEPPK
jgi:hypothetical protein